MRLIALDQDSIALMKICRQIVRANDRDKERLLKQIIFYKNKIDGLPASARVHV